MADTYTLPGVLLTGTHSGRPAASAVADGTLYAETDTGQTYQSDGVSTWTAWGAAAVGGSLEVTDGSGTPDVTGVVKMTFPSGAVTDDGGGAVTIAGGGGGGGGALVLLEQHTAASSAALDFTTVPSATYDEYMFEFLSVLPATNGGNLYLEVGTGGGPTWDTGSNYGYATYEWQPAGAAAGGGSTGQHAIILTRNGISNTATFGLSGFIKLYNPSSASLMFTVGKLTYWYSLSGVVITSESTGLYTVAGSTMTGFRFIMSTGNIASGTIRVYGIAKV